MTPLFITSAVALIGLAIWFSAPKAHGQEIRYAAPKPGDEVPTIPKMKAALRAVENTPWTVRGQSNEVTSYQIMPQVWREWSLMPVEEAARDTPEARQEAEFVVSKHLAWIRRCVERQGYTVTPYTIALVWKAGYGRFVAYKTRFQDVQYAQRAANVYEVTK